MSVLTCELSLTAKIAQKYPVHITEISSFVGQSSVDVNIDESVELTALVEEAGKLKDLPFEEKLKQVTQIAAGAMRNGIKDMNDISQDQLNFVSTGRELSAALRGKIGCCRFYATLFLVLGEAAQLGSLHYLESTRRTCFNRVFDSNGVCHKVYVPAATYSARLPGESARYFEDELLFKDYDVNRGGGRADVFLSYEVDASGKIARYKTVGSHLDKVVQIISAMDKSL